MKEVLMVFVKNRTAGKVKTRLAADIGDKAALEVYNKLLNYTQKVVAQSAMSIQVWFSELIPEHSNWVDIPAQLKLQAGKDLGDRMSNAFRLNFEEGAEKVLIIGSDCAELTSDHLKKASKLLNQYDLVIGPAKDGGYYLIAMKEYRPELFLGINWSTASVLKETLRIAEEAGLTVTQMDELNDVDELEDWNEVRHRFN